jgi:hypothetical protein
MVGLGVWGRDVRLTQVHTLRITVLEHGIRNRQCPVSR